LDQRRRFSSASLRVPNNEKPNENRRELFVK
jgi:hypothetical protein